jgi:hypothetical protein
MRPSRRSPSPPAKLLWWESVSDGALAGTEGTVRYGRSALMIREARPRIKRRIDAGVPTPICLLKVKDSLDPSDLQHNLGTVRNFIPMAYQKVTPPAIA